MPPLNEDAARERWRAFRAKNPAEGFRAVAQPWDRESDARLRRGVHYYLQKARAFSKERMTLEEVAGFGEEKLEDLLDDSERFAGVARARTPSTGRRCAARISRAARRRTVSCGG